MSGTGADHYETLQIGRAASPAEVKQAYFRLVRVHSPEDDAARFQAISEAYRVLSDPDARKAYDSDERLAPAVEEALGTAWSLHEKEPDRAFAMGKELLAVHGASPLVRCVVAGLYMNCGHAAEAVPIFEKLAREFPGRADFVANLGTAYLRNYQIALARQTLEAAIELDPKRRATYMEMASLADRVGSPEQALQTLERGMRAGGGPDMGALPMQLRRLSILARNGRWDEMTRVVDEIRASVPASDADAARHVASQLNGLGEQYVRANACDVGKFLVDAAFSVDPHPALKARSEQLASAATAAQACRDAHGDDRVADWLRSLLPQHYGVSMSDDQWRELWGSIVLRIRRKPWWADRQWNRFISLHPMAAAAVVDHWKSLRQQARGANAAPTTFSMGGVAGAVFFVLILVSVISSCVDKARRPAPAHLPSFDRRVSAPDEVPEWAKDMTKEELDRAAKIGLEIARDGSSREAPIKGTKAETSKDKADEPRRAAK